MGKRAASPQLDAFAFGITALEALLTPQADLVGMEQAHVMARLGLDSVIQAREGKGAKQCEGALDLAE